MKFCAYMTLCLCLPFAVLAEEEVDKGEPEDDAAAAEAVADPGFERFRTILDRMPFGVPPPGFNPDAPGGAADGPRGAGARRGGVANRWRGRSGVGPTGVVAS